VLVRYPVDGRQSASGREAWPWPAGTVEQQCGPDEWLVTIEDRHVAELEDGSPAPEGTPDDDLMFPQCYQGQLRTAPRPAVRPGCRTVTGWHLWLGFGSETAPAEESAQLLQAGVLSYSR
jgi:hypothetical protein